MMNRRYGGRAGIYYSGVGRAAPIDTDSHPQFVSCQRLPTPSTPAAVRRTVTELFRDACYYVCIVCITAFLLGLLLQAVMYSYLQTPGGRSAGTGQKLTHYGILGVDPDADQDAITTGWRLQSETFHPDNADGGNTEETRERYYWIQLAYVELSDPVARCYHDQYNGYLPRNWGKDDPCIKILMQRERESRELPESIPNTVRDEILRKREKDYGVSLNWLKVPKKKRDGKEWKDAGWFKQKRLSLWEALEDYGKQLVAWKYVAVGFVLTVIERYWNSFVDFLKKHAPEIRRQYTLFVAAAAEVWATLNTS